MMYHRSAAGAALNLDTTRRANSLADNTTAQAKDLAVLGAGYGSKRVRASDSVGARDSADFFKVTLLPGASISRVSGTSVVRRSPVNLSVTAEIQGNRVNVVRNFQAKVGRQTDAFSPDNSPLRNNLNEPVYIYIKLSPVRRQESKYSVEFNFFQ